MNCPRCEALSRVLSIRGGAKRRRACDACGLRFTTDEVLRVEDGMALSEAEVRKYFVKRVAEVGAQWRKVSWVGRSNAPDELLMRAKSEPVFVELKSGDAGPKFPSTPHERAQAREHAEMRKHGCRVEVIWSKTQIDELLGG